MAGQKQILPFPGEGDTNIENFREIEKRLKTISGDEIKFDWNGVNLLVYVGGVLVKTL